MEFLKLLIFKITRVVLHCFYIFPIKDKRVFFESYNGRDYCCNPRYICERLLEIYDGELDVIWSINHSRTELENKFTVVKHNSLRYFYYRLTSAVIITNIAGNVYIPKRKEQKLLNTWHAGGAYKKVGSSVNNKHMHLLKWQTDIVNEQTNCFLSSSKFFTKYNIREGYKFDGNVLPYGMPRNDMFFCREKIVSISKKVRELYNVGEAIIVLYAPTFRDHTNSNAKNSNVLSFRIIINAIEEKYKKKCVVFYRAHHYDSKKDIENVIDTTNYPDMQELLAASDILITDYSSSMWDFALLKRPCLLFVPDIDQYLSNRGLFTPINMWPGFPVRSENEVVDTIKSMTTEMVQSTSDKHLSLFGSYEKGNATEKCCEYLKQWLS